MKVNWVGHIMSKNRLLKHVIEGKIGGRIEVTRRRRRRCKQTLNDLKEIYFLEFARARTRPYSAENWLWKRLWTFRKTDYVINE